MKKLQSVYYNIETPDGIIHMHVDYNDTTKKIENVFIGVPPIGTPINELTSLVGILLSNYFRLGGDIKNLYKYFNSIRSSKRTYVEGVPIENITQGIGLALRNFGESILAPKEETEKVG